MSTSDRLILDEFGKALMEEVRDVTCSNLQGLVSGNMADKQLKKLGQLVERQQFTPAQFKVVGELLMYAVDWAMANFLQFLDAHEIGIHFRDASGQVHDIQAMSDGLSAEPYTVEGWIQKFSEFKEDAVIEKVK